MLRFLFPVVVVSVLAGCSARSQPPMITFIGVASGTLATDLTTLQFRDRFSPSERTLVGIVVLGGRVDDTTVQADWHSPDIRSRPIGRTMVILQSGATVARFSFASDQNFASAPYLFNVLAWKGDGKERMTASGSVQFFTGMTDDEIISYLETAETHAKSE